jgi:acetyl-CoA acyltransferase
VSIPSRPFISLLEQLHNNRVNINTFNIRTSLLILAIFASIILFMKAVICNYVRTPFTLANKGGLQDVRADDLLASVIKAVAKNENDIEDVRVGCAFPEGEQGLNIARNAIFIAGLPISIAGITINRFCGSSMQAVIDSACQIAAGGGDLFIAAGVEQMSHIPMGGYNPSPNEKLYESNPAAYESMGITAENVAKLYKISRKEMEEFALLSHQKAAKADFSKEVIEVAGVKKDGCIRADSSLEKMATLSPAFLDKGVITAATSSPLTDGASAVLIASEEYADKHGLNKMAYIKSFAVSGCKPELMGLGPIAASQKALARAGISAKDLDIIELNEAFAAQAIACIRDLELDINKINLDGGALALGHPLGATGARIAGKVASLLVRENKRYGLATQCIGGGMGIAVVLERC